ncbi:MAG: riboflavin synthase [Candidatus Omnitrophica bacterium]|nr:riboflavin synthase [Candidatus Omnitrophota bacterium]MDD5653081.1 riboflavin synthase [Candidatus Omnitrophota bacterium]
MFTGIIEELGVVKGISRRPNIVLLEIAAKKVLDGTKIGDSIALNGVCLTVVKIAKNILSFEVMPRTFKVTNLAALKTADKVNLERSLKIGDRLSGHFVYGHIDCVGVIRKKTFRQNNPCFEIAIPSEFAKYCLSKGAIAIDGISLTIAEKKADTFTVCIIPHTLENTNLKAKMPSDKVNLEFDILAKRNQPF